MSRDEREVPAEGWDWGRDVRPGMLFRIDDDAWVRVRARRGPRARPSDPDPDDVLALCRALGAGRRVVLDRADPATRGWLAVAGGRREP